MTNGAYGINSCGDIGAEAARTAMGWAKEPCPSQQPVTVPLGYLVNGERSKGVVIGTAAGVCGMLAVCIAAKLFKN